MRNKNTWSSTATRVSRPISGTLLRHSTEDGPTQRSSPQAQPGKEGLPSFTTCQSAPEQPGSHGLTRVDLLCSCISHGLISLSPGIHCISTLGPGLIRSAVQRNEITQILTRNSWKCRIPSGHRSSASSSVKNIGLYLGFCLPNIFCFHTHLLLCTFLSLTAAGNVRAWLSVVQSLYPQRIPLRYVSMTPTL